MKHLPSLAKHRISALLQATLAVHVAICQQAIASAFTMAMALRL